MSALARAVIALYPAPWRERYGEELGALLDDTGVGPSALLDLLRGAVAAHLREPLAWAVVWWGLFVLAGLGFYKTTENYGGTGDAHPVLGGAHLAVEVLAGLTAVVAAAAVWRQWQGARRSGFAAPLLSLGMVATAVSVAVYSVALPADAGDLAAEANGPGGLVSVGLSLALQAGVMTLAAGLGVRAAARSRRRVPPPGGRR